MTRSMGRTPEEKQALLHELERRNGGKIAQFFVAHDLRLAYEHAGKYQSKAAKIAAAMTEAQRRGSEDDVYGAQRADQVAAMLSTRAWNRYSAGDGAKGHREYDWAWVAITPPGDERTGHHALLIRRSLTDDELAFYRCWPPQPIGLPTLVRVAGTRWCMETCFQTGKNATGLDEHQVRRWPSWYRYTTLVMLAHAILTVIATRERARPQSTDAHLIPLTVNEIRRLFAKLATNIQHTIDHWLAWSRWRRLHQARAKTSHYRRRGHPEHRPAST